MESTPTPHHLASQIAGHPGIIQSEDGSSIGKPAFPLEHKFYEAIYGDNPKLQKLQDFKLLEPFIPKLMGTLRLVGRLDESQGDDILWLDNVTYPFLKPNQMDLKLGTVLYDELGGVTDQKKERMIETAKNTTSKDTGIRIAGFQVYKNTTPEIGVDFTKQEGKALKAADLPGAIALFFPVGSEPLSEPDPPPETAAVPRSGDCGLPSSILLPILRGIHAEIVKIREVYSTIEMRMVGGSFLIVYEADWARAAEGLERLKREEGRESGVIDEEEDEEEEEEDEAEEDEEEDENGGKGKGTTPFVVKLIDFAHTHVTPGEGPDEGVVQGMSTVLELLAERIDHLERGQGTPS